MTQEQKDLLIKDLCGRLSHGVKCKILEINEVQILGSIQYDGEDTLFDFWEDDQKIQFGYQFYLSEFKPYLFPLSSMTDEQRDELYKMGWYLDEDKIYSCFRNYDDVNYKTHIDCFELVNWCYKNNLDINGLIPIGLAIDATGLNIY